MSLGIPPEFSTTPLLWGAHGPGVPVMMFSTTNFCQRNGPKFAARRRKNSTRGACTPRRLPRHARDDSLLGQPTLLHCEQRRKIEKGRRSHAAEHSLCDRFQGSPAFPIQIWRDREMPQQAAPFH